MDGLMTSGCTLLDSLGDDSQSQQEAWSTFTSATDKAIAEYNKTYEAAVIHAAQSGPNAT